MHACTKSTSRDNVGHVFYYGSFKIVQLRGQFFLSKAIEIVFDLLVKECESQTQSTISSLLPSLFPVKGA